MFLGGLQKTSLLDFPDKISAIVFTQGCNFRCGYCHNPELIALKEPVLTVPAFFEFLSSRKGKLDGVVITGGEPCLQSDLIDFIKQIKDMGFLVKLDTNGTFPDKIIQALPYLDYIAMDIKAPLEKYPLITNSKILGDKIQESINIIMSSKLGYEFRTTVVKSQLSYEDFSNIADLIEGAEKYYLQKFVPSKTLDPKMMGEKTYTDKEFEDIINILNQKIKHVAVR